jgi:hypothetical protein
MYVYDVFVPVVHYLSSCSRRVVLNPTKSYRNKSCMFSSAPYVMPVV